MEPFISLPDGEHIVQLFVVDERRLLVVTICGYWLVVSDRDGYRLVKMTAKEVG